MAIGKVVLHDDSGADRTLVDLTGDTVAPETLIKGTTAHDKAGNLITGTVKPGEGGPQVQSDWAENDPQSPAYVKNRPFYSEQEVSVEVPEQTVRMTDSDKGYFSASADSGPAKLSGGESVIVNWDGADYVNVVEEGRVSGFAWMYYLGNLSIVSSGADTGEPFLLMGNPPEWSAFKAYAAVGGEHTFNVSKNIEKVVSIPNKYLGDSVGKKTEGHGEIFNDYKNNGAFGPRSHAEGAQTMAGEAHAHAEGFQTVATGVNSHAEGRGTSAGGNNAHAEGYKSKALGPSSHSEGVATIADGMGSHSEGSNRGEDNTADLPDIKYLDDTGRQTIVGAPRAAGGASHAEGVQTYAKGYASHAGGIGTAAMGKGSTAIGMWNDYTHDTLLAIGNGTSHDSRHNAFEVLPDGSVVLPSSTSGSTKYFKISVDDTGAIKSEEII